MKNLIAIAVLLVVSSVAWGQDTLHITSTHHATRDYEKTYRTSLGQNIMTGTIGNRLYTFEQPDLPGFMGGFHFEVGQDYSVVKADDKEIKVRIHVGKKDKEITYRLSVITVEEAPVPEKAAR